ncbi:MAG: flippase-like domain-containing protein [Candidatus Thermoplasmatota archaeon]|nr:flippase-like domain-containing protein [Candidatus Thermoplasmatota archaeon]
MRLKKLLPVVGVILFVFILSQLDFAKIMNIFSQLNPLYVLLSFFVFVPLLLLVNIEWQLLLKRQKIHVSYWYSIKNFFIGYFYGFITPGGLGAYTRSLYLSKESDEPLAKCLSNIVTFNTIEYLALLSLGFIGAVFLIQVYPFLFIVILTVVVLVLSVYIFFVKSNQSQRFLQKLIEHPLFSKTAERLKDSLESFHKDVPNFKDAILPFSLSITGWILKYVMLFFIARLFNVSIPFHFFIFIIAVADVIASIPISIYGIGTREAALITMFSVPYFTNDLLISAEQVVSLSLFWFVIIWLTPSVIGAFVTLYETKKMSSFKFDEKDCKQFDRYMQKYQYLYRNLVDIVNRYVKTSTHPVIVDLGVGPGLLSKEMNKKIPDARIIGIDPSEQMISLANKNANIDSRIGSSEQLPLEDESVDVVVTRYTLTYWKNPNQGFQEISRVLKPNGVFIIEALNKDFSKLRLFLIKLQMLFKNSSFSVAQYHIDAYKTAFSIKSVVELFEKNGFTIVQSRGNTNDWMFLVVGKK